jgi:hypothetical protein
MGNTFRRRGRNRKTPPPIPSEQDRQNAIERERKYQERLEAEKRTKKAKP